MITMALMGKIRGMHFRDGKSISEISRQTSLSCNTIKKWLKVPQGAQPKYRRPEVPTKLTPFVEALTLALQADAHRPKRERRTALALHAELQTLGYPDGYTRLTQFIRQWRERSFTALGGILRRGIYDNMKTAVDKVKKGKGRIVNARFAVMCAHYLYDPDQGPKGPFVAQATSPVVGRRASSRRTFRTAAGAYGWIRASCALAPSPNSTPGWATAAAPCGTSCATPSTTSSAWPRCLSTNCRI